MAQSVTALGHFAILVLWPADQLLKGEEKTRMKSNVRILVLVSLVLVAPVFFVPIRPVHAAGINSDVRVSLTPAVINMTQGSTFSLKFQVANVTGLNGWEIHINYDPAVLTGLSTTDYVYEGFTAPSTDPLNIPRAITVDNTAGEVIMGKTAFPLPYGINGTGNLARIDFSVNCSSCVSNIVFFDPMGTMPLTLAHGDAVAGTVTPIVPSSVAGAIFTNKVNTPPTARFTFNIQPPSPPPIVANVNQTIFFDATTSNSPNGAIVSYKWDFGDSNITTVITPTIAHAYTKAGVKTVLLVVIDIKGLSGSTSQTVPVRSSSTGHIPPTAYFSIGSTGQVLTGQNITFDASQSKDSNIGGVLILYMWDFGDGAKHNWTVPMAWHIFRSNGTFTVSLIVENGNGLKSSPFSSFVHVGTRINPVGPNQTPWTIYGLIAGVAVAVVIGLAFFARRRARLKEESAEPFEEEPAS